MNTGSIPEIATLNKKDALFLNLYRPPALKHKMTSVPQPPSVSDNLELSQIFQLPKIASSIASSHGDHFTMSDKSAAFMPSSSNRFQTSSSQFHGRGNGDIQSGSSWLSGCVPVAPDVGNDLMLTQAFQNRHCEEDKDFDVALSIFGDKTSQNSSFSGSNRNISSSRFPSFDDSVYCGSKLVHPVSFSSSTNCRPLKSTSQTTTQSEKDQFCLNFKSSVFDEAFIEDFDSSWDHSASVNNDNQRDIFSGPPDDVSSTTYSHENLQTNSAQPVYREKQILKNHFPLHDKGKKLNSSFRTPFLKRTSEVTELDGSAEKTQQNDLTHNFTGRFSSQDPFNSCAASAEPYRAIFQFEYFNIVQSVVFDDVFYTDKPLVVSAPTGSGKTVIFELAIIRLLIHQQKYQMNKNATFKVVYMAPIKALCSERFEDWNIKFGPLGLKCMELTGDSEIEDYYELQEVNIILTTPEKWDHMTRRWRDNKSLVQLTRLFMIDEVHTLNDDVRGATLEAVVSRMKTVQLAIARSQAASSSAVTADMATETNLRFVAVSATIPNIADVAEWLNSKNTEAVYHKLDDSHRPVRLRKVVLGFPCADKTSEFRFDMTLNYKLAGIVQTYSELKPTLIFCSTRKGAVQAATTLVKEAKFIFNLQQKQKLQKFANSLRDTKLGDLITSGVGYHHAGMEVHDRKMVENIFAKGELAVLVSTSTLAMGVNLPAHLVIIKSTQHYVNGVYQEYTETQILQMIGRAGRPQFDTTATAVIMTRSSTKSKYESLLNGTQVIESSLHQHLVEHLNAETVLETICDVSVALEWIRSTFLYIRINKNPTHYGIPSGLTNDKVEQKLQELCLKNLNALASIQLVQMDEDCFALKSSNTGRLMARYCVAFETMKNFHNVVGKESLEEMLGILCQSHEFNDIQLRVSEKKTLNTLNSSKNTATIRFPMQGKIKSALMKVNCLIQAHLGSLPLQDFALQQDTAKIIRVCQRISRCLVEVLWNRQDFTSLQSAVIICKCFASKLWENSKFISRQLTGIGITLATALVNAGMTSFERISNTNARDLEMIVNRQPPFGNHIHEAIAHLPKYELSIKQTTQVMASYAEVVATVTIANADSLNEKCTTHKGHTLVLLIGDDDGKVVYKVRISDAQLLLKGPWTRKIEVKRATAGDELSAYLISQQWVGLDCQMTFVPEYTTPAKTPIINQQAPTSTENRKTPKKLCVAKTKETPVLPRNNSANGKKTQDAKMRTIESCLDNCKTAAMIKAKAASAKTTGSVDSCCRELKLRLEGYDKTPAVKRLKMSGVPATPSLKDFAYQPSKPKILKHVASADPVPFATQGWEDLDLFQLRNQAAMEWTVQDADHPGLLEEDFLDADPDLDCYVAEDFQTDSRNNRNAASDKAKNNWSLMAVSSSFEELPDLGEDDATDAWNRGQGTRFFQDQTFVDSKGQSHVPVSNIVERYNEDDFSDFEDRMFENCGLISDEYGKGLPSNFSKLASCAMAASTEQTQKDTLRNSKGLSSLKPVPSLNGSRFGSYCGGSSLISDGSRANFDLMSSFSLNAEDDLPSPSAPDHHSLLAGVEPNVCTSKSKPKKHCPDGLSSESQVQQLSCGSMMNMRSSSFFSSDAKNDGAIDEDHVISDDIFFGIF